MIIVATAKDSTHTHVVDQHDLSRAAGAGANCLELAKVDVPRELSQGWKGTVHVLGTDGRFLHDLGASPCCPNILPGDRHPAVDDQPPETLNRRRKLFEISHRRLLSFSPCVFFCALAALILRT